MQNNSRTKFYLAIVVVTVPFTFFWMELFREVIAENQEILANSTVAEAVVMGVTESRSRRRGTSYWVNHRYNVRGVTYAGEAPISSGSMKNAIATGSVSILYNAAHPSQSHLRDHVQMMSSQPPSRNFVTVAVILALMPSVFLNGAYLWLSNRFEKLPNPYRKSTTA